MLELLIAAEVTSSAVALPSELMLIRKLPISPNRIIVPLARLSIATSTRAYKTALMRIEDTLAHVQKGFHSLVFDHQVNAHPRGLYHAILT